MRSPEPPGRWLSDPRSDASFPVDCCVDDPAAGVLLVAQPTTAGATAPVVRVERA